jgi:hypothetical protein
MAELIAATTNQADSADITIPANGSVVIACTPPLKGDEKVILLHRPTGAGNFEPASTPQGSAILNEKINRNMISGEGTVRIRKSPTASAVAVHSNT